MRRWLHEVGWVWKRAKLVAKDDDPHRVERLARIRCIFEQLKCCQAMVFADELDIHLLPKVGCAWMPKGTQLEVMTPGQNQKNYLAGALDLTTGRCTTAWSHAKLTRCSRTCSSVSMQAIRLNGIRSSLWWWITIRFIKQKLWGSGWPPTRG